MIASVHGVIASRSGDGAVVIETDGGVGYTIAVPAAYHGVANILQDFLARSMR